MECAPFIHCSYNEMQYKKYVKYRKNTKSKRHMVGGILMSVSLFFGGLAFTMMTIKGEDNESDNS